jgi:hypothetical protein
LIFVIPFPCYPSIFFAMQQQTQNNTTKETNPKGVKRL